MELLRTYHDVQLPELGMGSDSSDDRVLLMSKLWHEGSYKELHRALYVMRAERPSEYWHVAERYLRCTRRQTMGCPECGQWTPEHVNHHKHRNKLTGKPEKVHRGPIVEERWNPRVEWCDKCVLGKACSCALGRGLEYLSLEFRGEPFLPAELYKLVAA